MMEKRPRRSIRLKGFDYSKNGAYFITICTEDRECLFGRIVNGEMLLNEYGEIIDNGRGTLQRAPTEN